MSGRVAIKRKGMILILSSPSGAGKTTLTRMLLQDKTLDLTLSISVTTRARRSSEVDGVHYHFIAPERFEAMKRANDLLEFATVHGHGYGTPKKPVLEALVQGRDILFDIDWQGAQQVKRAMGEDVVSVFILPPSMAELRARLDRRAEDAPAVIAARLENAKKEIARWTHYDYVLVNDDLQRAYAQTSAIIGAERLRGKRVAPAVEGFVSELLAE